VLALEQEGISGSTYSKFFFGDHPQAAYNDISHAFELLGQRAKACHAILERSYTWSYFHQLDSMCHKAGTDTGDSESWIEQFCTHIDGFMNQIPSNAKVLITADHGMINIPGEHVGLITDTHPLMAYMERPPSGEGRVRSFFVKPDKATGFIDTFHEYFGDHMVCVPREEAISSGVFGAETSQAFESRIGNYVGFARKNYVVDYEPDAPGHRGVHAGLTNEEMEIPLLIS
jgi:hypothetical protein